MIPYISVSSKHVSLVRAVCCFAEQQQVNILWWGREREAACDLVALANSWLVHVYALNSCVLPSS